ncbi:MAG: zinc-ribbon domain-containing protein [Lachnospiraceae bacterium]
MSFMEDIRDGREGYVRGNIGDRLVAVEAVIMGIALGFFLYFKAGMSIPQYIVIASIITVVIIWLVGNIPVIAWIVGILFSLVWAAVGFIIGSLIFDESIIAGILAAVVVFALSLFCHKVFAGIGYISRRKYLDDSLDDITGNLNNISNHLNDAAGILRDNINNSQQQQIVQQSVQPSLGQAAQPVLGQSEQFSLEQSRESASQPSSEVFQIEMAEMNETKGMEEAVHICFSCGAKLRQEDVFCNKCGARQA